MRRRFSNTCLTTIGVEARIGGHCPRLSSRPPVQKEPAMRPACVRFPRLIASCIFCTLLAAARRAAAITSVTKNPGVRRQIRQARTHGRRCRQPTNPYDPEEIDLSAEFTSPAGKVWKINGFYDGKAYKIRFAANETGAWKYVVAPKTPAGPPRASRAPSPASTPNTTDGSPWPRTNAICVATTGLRSMA